MELVKSILASLFNKLVVAKALVVLENGFAILSLLKEILSNFPKSLPTA